LIVRSVGHDIERERNLRELALQTQHGKLGMNCR
jgi:hypothetical protein